MMIRIGNAIRNGSGIAMLVVAAMGCSKGSSPNPTPPTPDACAGKNVTVTATSTDANSCANDGSITATAAGSTNFSYSIDGRNFQSAASFTTVPQGTYTVTVKDGAGCRATAQVTVASRAATKGPLWTAVRSLITSRCAIPGCHVGNAPTGGLNFSNDCVVLGAQANIKLHAVDLGDMPEGGPMLNEADKKKITDWIAAGGQFAN